MGKVVIRWSMKKFIWMIVQILNNKFDCFIIIEGSRGLGKSTLGIQIAKKISNEFKKMGRSDLYKFNMRNSLIYTKKETLNFFHKRRSNGIADEMINVCFNRDFYNEDQKNIIKMINMNRDHYNLFVACVPQFQTLDAQIKNLCKIRITITRRGLALIQTPNRTIYVKDKWDQATNEKIERQWLQKGITKPHYTKLTTFRGILLFSKLDKKTEASYQEVKDMKRNIVAKEEMGLDMDSEKIKDPYMDTIDKLIKGKVRNGIFLDGLAVAYDIKPDAFRNNIRGRLRKQGISTRLTDYYWDKGKKQKDYNPATIE